MLLDRFTVRLKSKEAEWKIHSLAKEGAKKRLIRVWLRNTLAKEISVSKSQPIALHQDSWKKASSQASLSGCSLCLC
jgi:hypothetical protein